MTTMYEEASEEIRKSVVEISNKFELAKYQTIAILAYLSHDIMTLNDSDNG